MIVSIVIPTFGRPGLAEKLKLQIEKFHRNNYEVIIVKSSGNTSETKNKGIKMSRGEIVIFFDDDVEITKETIPSHLQTYSDHKIIGVAGRVINDSDRLPGNTDVDTGKTNLMGTKFDYKFWSTKKQEVDFVYGCNMSFRKSALLKIKGFDEQFPKIFEEVDLSKRIKKLGKIIFEPQALVYHHKATFGGIRPEEKQAKQKLIFANYGRYLAKNIFFPLSLISLLLRARTALKISLPIAIELLKGYIKSLSKYKPLIFFLPLIIFLRFWKVPEFFIFTFSEEWQGTLAWAQIKDFHPIWIGVSQANINYFLAPGFIYLNYLLFLVKNGDPAVLAYFSAILGMVNIFVLYFVTEKIFSKKVAVFAALIYGCSTLINYFDRRFWNPSFVPLVSLLFVYSLIKANENTRWYILTAVLIGLSFHFHLLLLLFLLPTFYSVFKNIKKIKPVTYLLSLIFYLLLTFPLIVFDLNHNFDNLFAPYKIIFEGKKTGLYTFSLENVLIHLQSFTSTLGRIWFTKLNSNLQDIVLETNTYKIQGNIILSFLTLIALVYFFFKNRQKGFRFFLISMVTIVLAYLIYPSYNPEYYLMGFITLLTIAIGYWLNSLPNLTAYLIMTVFILINILTVITTKEDYGLIMRKKLNNKISC